MPFCEQVTMGSRSLESDGMLNGELAGSRDDLRRGLGSPEDDHDDACANGRSARADEGVIRIAQARATAEESSTLASSPEVRVVAGLTFPHDNQNAAHDREDD